MRFLVFLLGALCVLFLSACVIVPIPHKRVHELGIKGQIIDARTRAPVTAAKIEDTLDATQSTYSSMDGSFLLKPVYGWHGGYIVAGVGGSVFPEHDGPSPARTITITAPGYRSLTVPLGKSGEQGAYIDAGTISLQR
jgi:hypothetical protein